MRNVGYYSPTVGEIPHKGRDRHCIREEPSRIRPGTYYLTVTNSKDCPTSSTTIVEAIICSTGGKYSFPLPSLIHLWNRSMSEMFMVRQKHRAFRPVCQCKYHWSRRQQLSIWRFPIDHHLSLDIHQIGHIFALMQNELPHSWQPSTLLWEAQQWKETMWFFACYSSLQGQLWATVSLTLPSPIQPMTLDKWLSEIPVCGLSKYITSAQILW